MQEETDLVELVMMHETARELDSRDELMPLVARTWHERRRAEGKSVDAEKILSAEFDTAHPEFLVVTIAALL